MPVVHRHLSAHDVIVVAVQQTRLKPNPNLIWPRITWFRHVDEFEPLQSAR